MQKMEGLADTGGLQLGEILALNCRREILPPTFLGDVASETRLALQANQAAGLP